MAEPGSAIEDEFRRVHGYTPDLRRPRSFSEKLAVRIAFDDDPLFGVVADKYLAPYYAASRAGPELEFANRYGAYRQLEVSDLVELPNAFVLKGSHGSGANAIVPNRDDVDLDEIVERMNRRTSAVHNARGDRNPGAVILAEEYLVERGLSSPTDYKFHCFRTANGGGFRWVLQVDVDRFGDHIQNIYDEDLEILDFTWSRRAGDGAPFRPPKQFERMLQIAGRLSRDFDYVRVDLYNIDGRIVFGEITPFHQAGRGPVEPAEWDFRLGDRWVFDPGGTRLRFSRQPRA